jgi:hypothetical protein
MPNLISVSKFFFYIGLSGVKAFMAALTVAMVFFVEVFFMNKYVDPNLAAGIMPVVEMARTNWVYIFVAIFIFDIIINFKSINMESQNQKV